MPGLLGPAIAALLAPAAGWRWVFLGLLRRLMPPRNLSARQGFVATILSRSLLTCSFDVSVRSAEEAKVRQHPGNAIRNAGFDA